MADAITIKALQDASLDAKTLEEVVNGNDTKQVTTRLGENYPSVKKAVKTMFENGGLPATPFATKALMESSDLTDGSYAAVTDDSTNNGLYLKDSGQWGISAYDPVKESQKSVVGSVFAPVLRHHYNIYSSELSDTLKTFAKGRIVVDTNIKKIYISQGTIMLTPRGFPNSLPAGAISYDTEHPVIAVYYDPSMQEYKTDLAAKQALYDGSILICTVQTGIYDPMLSVNGDIEYTIDLSEGGIPLSQQRVGIIQGASYPTRKQNIFNYDTATNTLKIPRDTVISIDGVARYTNSLQDLEVSIGTTSSARKVFFDFVDEEYFVVAWNTTLSIQKRFRSAYVCGIRDRGVSSATRDPSNVIIDLPVPYTVDGMLFGIDSFGEPPKEAVVQNSLNDSIKAVAHRGYSITHPENTIPAYIEAKAKGYSYVECDVRITSDGIPVLLHDSTVDRTSNGLGSISEMTLDQVKQLDFGSWKGSEFAGVQIPTLDEFLSICRQLSLHPYLEMKDTSKSAINLMHEAVKKAGMLGKVTYIGYPGNLLDISMLDPKARLGQIIIATEISKVNSSVAHKTGTNEVFVDVGADLQNMPAMIEECRRLDVGIEVWTVNNPSHLIQYAEMGVGGITTDNLNVRELINNNYGV